MLWMRVATTFYRRATLMVRSLDSVEAYEPRVPARIANVRPDDLEAYLRFRPRTRPGQVESRFATGHVLVAGWVEGRIVHAAWVATGRAHVAYLRRDLMLQADELLVYDSYTLPEFRESGIARARMTHVFQQYRERGFRRCLAIVAAENEIGRRAVESAGYRAVGGYRCVRLGAWDRCWREPAGDARVPELHLPTSD